MTSPTGSPEPVLRFTATARERIAENLEASGGGLALRVEASRRGSHGFDYQLTLVGLDEREPDDEVVDAGSFLAFVDPASAELLRGTTMRFSPSLTRHGFDFDNPRARWDDPVADAVQRVLDDEINPRVGSHGGWVVLREVRDGVAYLEMGGGCQGCGKAEVTLRQGVEEKIRQAVPAVREVVDTTEHEAGENPFFLPGQEGDSPI